MATVYKFFGPDDATSTRTLLYENIPVTGSLVSSSNYLDSNIKTYTHGMFKSVYDYPYLSSSANHLFDITIGRSNYATSSLQSTTKQAIYNQMAKVLFGTDATGSIIKFDDNGTTISGTMLDNLYFVNFSRLLVKDEIKRGSFSMDIGIGNTGSVVGRFENYITLADYPATSSYFIDSPTGEYGILYAYTASNAHSMSVDSLYVNNTPDKIAASASQGLIFYQAGIAAISPYIFALTGTASPSVGNGTFNQNTKGILTGSGLQLDNTNKRIGDIFVSGTIDSAVNVLRERIKNISFNNTTELNSTIYFCRVNNNEFNYSSNPTYLSGSEIRVKSGNALNAPVSYITTVGLYSADNQLLAVAKLSEPLKKTPSDEMIIRVRLDY